MMDWEIVQFRDRATNRLSVALAEHGSGLQQDADEFMEELLAKVGDNIAMPLQRLEPSILIVEFLRWHLVKHREELETVYSSLYLHPSWDERDGDLKIIDVEVRR